MRQSFVFVSPQDLRELHRLVRSIVRAVNELLATHPKAFDARIELDFRPEGWRHRKHKEAGSVTSWEVELSFSFTEEIDNGYGRYSVDKQFTETGHVRGIFSCVDGMSVRDWMELIHDMVSSHIVAMTQGRFMYVLNTSHRGPIVPNSHGDGHRFFFLSQDRHERHEEERRPQAKQRR